MFNTISYLNKAPCLLQVLPPLVGVCPEARLNMAIYHLRRGEAEQAFKVVKDLDPVAPPEYILKGEAGRLQDTVCRESLKQVASLRVGHAPLSDQNPVAPPEDILRSEAGHLQGFCTVCRKPLKHVASRHVPLWDGVSRAAVKATHKANRILNGRKGMHVW